MIDVNWDLAPEGAETLRQSEDGFLFFDRNNNWWDFLSGSWTDFAWSIDCSEEEKISTRGRYKIIATRPTQTKTVADAVEYYPSGWPKNMNDELWFSEVENRYMRRIEVLPKHKAYFVCDYLQFEAYVKEQEGEKWTHVTSIGKCRILVDKPDEHGYIVVEMESDGYSLIPERKLKPIKSTISKAEAWDMLKDLPANEWSIHSHLMELENKYEII